jgi:hypothetical protein
LFLDTFLNTVPNILCVVGQVFKQLGNCQASYFIELHRRIGQHTYNLLLCFLKQVTIKKLYIYIYIYKERKFEQKTSERHLAHSLLEFMNNMI